MKHDQSVDDESRFRSYTENAPYGVFIADERGRYLEVNPEACRITGYSEQELLSMSISDLLPQGAEEAGVAHFLRLLETGRSSGELPFKPKTGPNRYWSVDAVKLSDTRFMGFVQDVTARKANERALVESEQRFRAVFDHGSDGILVADPEDGTFLLANRVMCELLGYSREELLDLRVADIHPPEHLPAVEAEFEKHRRGEAELAHELPLMRKDGSVFFAELASSLVEVHGGKYVIGMFRDLTERRRAAQEKLEQEVRARHQQKLEAIGTLASGIAHEINNPLTVMMNMGQLILDEKDSTPVIREYAGMVVNEAERVATIVRALLAFARQEQQGAAPVQVAEIITATLEVAGALFRRDQINVQTRIAPGLPLVICRSQQIQQVLVNLLTNARDAVCERYPQAAELRKILIEASRVKKEGQVLVRIMVEDWGTGIPPEVAERVFDPFFSTKPKHKGTGLGLSTSFNIVKSHGGRLWFATEPGEGSRFYLDLRAEEGAAELNDL